MERALVDCSDHQKAGRLQEALEAAQDASWAIQRWEMTRDAERPQESPRKGRKASKRVGLPQADDWRSQVWMAADLDEQAGVAIVWATGCRPIELENGVDLEDHGDTITVTIPGAKVSERTMGGQPWRTITVDGSSDAGRALRSALGRRTKATIQVGRTQLAWTLERVGRQLGFKRRLSAYSFRHAVGSDAKTTMDKAEVAAVLGHASDRSQQSYGVRGHGRGRAILGATASRTVRQARPGPGPSPS